MGVSGGTLLRDAAHLAAPNGQGASLAILDRAEPGKALAAYPGDTEAALARYQPGAVCHRALPSRPAAPVPTPGAPPKGRGTGGCAA